MKTKTLTQQDLSHFYSTEGYHRWSALFRNFVLTDGAHFVAEKGEAYWLMDAIASHIDAYRDEGFAVATLTIKEGKGDLVLDDGNGVPLAAQRIDWTDFPLDMLKFYVIQQEAYWVIMLASEY